MLQIKLKQLKKLIGSKQTLLHKIFIPIKANLTKLTEIMYQFKIVDAENRKINNKERKNLYGWQELQSLKQKDTQQPKHQKIQKWSLIFLN